MNADAILSLLSSFASTARDSIADAVEARAERVARKAALYGTAGTFIAVALGFAGYAAYAALAPLWTPPLAALAVAGGALALAGLCVLIARNSADVTDPAQASDSAPASDPPPAAERDAVAAEIAGIVQRLQDDAERNGENLVVGSLAAGIALSLLHDRR